MVSSSPAAMSLQYQKITDAKIWYTIDFIKTLLQWSWLYSPQFSWHSSARSCCWTLMLIEKCTDQPLNMYMTTLKIRFWNNSHFLVTFEIKTVCIKNSRSKVNIILRKSTKNIPNMNRNQNHTFENISLLFRSLIFSRCGIIFFSVKFHDFVPFLLLTFPSSSLHPSVNNSLKIVTKGCNSLASVLFLLLFSLTPCLVRKLHSTLWGVSPRRVVAIFPLISLALHSSQIDRPHL